MPKNIYIITLFDDKQFISTNLDHLVKEINQYCQDNNIIDIQNNVYVFDKYKLKNRIFNGTKIIYPFKSMEKYLTEVYFKEELLKIYPNYHLKAERTRQAYIAKLIKSKNII